VLYIHRPLKGGGSGGERLPEQKKVPPNKDLIFEKRTRGGLGRKSANQKTREMYQEKAAKSILKACDNRREGRE